MGECCMPRCVTAGEALYRREANTVCVRSVGQSLPHVQRMRGLLEAVRGRLVLVKDIRVSDCKDGLGRALAME
jgi:hypothetical protein